MATVDKSIADRVIAGEFPEDNIIAIVQYNNQFNGKLAYGLCTSQHHIDGYMHSPHCHSPVMYWSKPE